MKKILKGNYKMILGIIIGILISGVVVYATTTISSSNVSYNNSQSGLKSTDMKGAIDEIYQKIKPCKVVSGTGKNIGDEIQCGTEHFYITSYSNDTTKMLAKYSIEVGEILNSSPVTITNPSYRQNSECYVGSGKSKGIDVSGACLTANGDYASKYKEYLSLLGLPDSISINHMSIQEFNQLGCNINSSLESYGYNISGNCKSSPYSWLLTGVYSIGISNNYCYYVLSSGSISCLSDFNSTYRPLVSIPTVYISGN